MKKINTIHYDPPAGFRSAQEIPRKPALPHAPNEAALSHPIPPPDLSFDELGCEPLPGGKVALRDPWYRRPSERPSTSSAWGALRALEALAHGVLVEDGGAEQFLKLWDSPALDAFAHAPPDERAEARRRLLSMKTGRGWLVFGRQLELWQEGGLMPLASHPAWDSSSKCIDCENRTIIGWEVLPFYLRTLSSFGSPESRHYLGQDSPRWDPQHFGHHGLPHRFHLQPQSEAEIQMERNASLVSAARAMFSAGLTGSDFQQCLRLMVDSPWVPSNVTNASQSPYVGANRVPRDLFMRRTSLRVRLQFQFRADEPRPRLGPLDARVSWMALTRDLRARPAMKALFTSWKRNQAQGGDWGDWATKEMVLPPHVHLDPSLRRLGISMADLASGPNPPARHASRIAIARILWHEGAST